MTKNPTDNLWKKKNKDMTGTKTDSGAKEVARISELLMLKRFLVRERQRNCED